MQSSPSVCLSMQQINIILYNCKSFNFLVCPTTSTFYAQILCEYFISPSISRCSSALQLAASSSRSESHTVRLAVRKSLRRRGKLRAKCWKQPELLWSVEHHPSSSSSSSLQPVTSSASPRSLRFLQRHRSRDRRERQRELIMLATTS